MQKLATKSLLTHRLLILFTAMSGGALRSEAQPFRAAEESSTEASETAKNTSSEYDPVLAERVLIYNIYYPLLAHFKTARLQPPQLRTDVDQWSRNWMNALDPEHILFLESDCAGIRKTLADFAQYGAKSIYNEVVVPTEKLAQQRFNESIAVVQELIKKNKFNLNDSDQLERDPTQLRFNANEFQRWDRTRRSLEEVLIEYELEGKDEAFALEQLKSRERRREIKINESLSNRNEQVARFINAFLTTLDPHSDFMPPEAAQKLTSHLSKETVGIGISLVQNAADEVVITEVYDDSPAQRGGLQSGDLILGSFDANHRLEPFNEMSLEEINAHIRGPVNTKVQFQIQRSAMDSTTGKTTVREFAVTLVRAALSQDGKRARVTLYSFEGKTIAVISAYNFYGDGSPKNGLSQDIKTVVEAAKKRSQISGVVLDLSGNQGGLFQEAVWTAGLFVKTGPITQASMMVNHQIHTRVVKDENPEQLFDVPVLVKIDGMTASSSEIVAAALQDLGVALVVGERTSHGKGTIQVTQPALRDPLADLIPELADSNPYRYGMLKLTTGAYYRLDGGTTQFNGVKADLPLYPEGASYFLKTEKTQPDALLPDTVSPAPNFDPSAHQFFDVDLREKLRSLNQKRVEQNLGLQRIAVDMREMRERSHHARSLKLQDRVSQRVKDQENTKAVIETLKTNHLIPGLKISEIAFKNGVPHYQEVNGLEDSDFGPEYRELKSDDPLRLGLQESYERHEAEIEAILPIFSDIEHLRPSKTAMATHD